MFFDAAIVTLFALVGGSVANPVEGNILEARVSPTNMVKINSAKDYCMIVPKDPHTNIGDSERPGGETTYCSNPSGSQGKFAPNFWKKVTYKSATGKHGKKYVQLTGCINTSTCDRLNPSDGGGQYDSSGGAGGRGNPAGSQCSGYAHYVELIEPSSNRACLRCCQDAADCPTNKDTQGCASVIPGSYSGC